MRSAMRTVRVMCTTTRPREAPGLYINENTRNVLMSLLFGFLEGPGLPAWVEVNARRFETRRIDRRELQGQRIAPIYNSCHLNVLSVARLVFKWFSPTLHGSTKYLLICFEIKQFGATSATSPRKTSPTRSSSRSFTASSPYQSLTLMEGGRSQSSSSRGFWLRGE